MIEKKSIAIQFHSLNRGYLYSTYLYSILDLSLLFLQDSNKKSYLEIEVWFVFEIR